MGGKKVGGRMAVNSWVVSKMACDRKVADTMAWDRLVVNKMAGDNHKMVVDSCSWSQQIEAWCPHESC